MTTRTNSIVEDQNLEPRLHALAAQRQLYALSKKVYAATAVASAAGAAVGVPLALAVPQLKPWVAIYGLVLAVLDLTVLEAWQKTKQRAAADIQEDFDCQVLRLPFHPIRRPASTDPETLHELVERQRRVDPGLSALRNWYPADVAELPPSLARLACQRTNLRWDAELRRTYARMLLGLLLLLGAAIPVAAVWANLAAPDLLLVLVAPALPFVVWAGREYKRQRDAASADDATRAKLESAWQASVATPASEQDAQALSRAIQDDIYLRRRTEPPVFDWVYRLLKNRYESHAAAGVRDLIRQAAAHDTPGQSG